MRNFRDDPSMAFILFAVIILLLILAALGLIGYGMYQTPARVALEPSAATIVEPTVATPTPSPVPPTITPRPTVTPEPTKVLLPTPQPTSTPTEMPPAEFVIGIAEREIDCRWFSDLVGEILIQELGVTVEQVEFDSAETLFNALADGTVNITFCFVDPTDRSQISGENSDRTGFLRQIGRHYFETESGKLQIWAHGAAKTEMRKEHPCAVALFEEMELLPDLVTEADAITWMEENDTLVNEWVTCES